MKKNEYLCKRENFANYKVNHRFESPEFGFPDEVFEFVNTEGKGVVQFAFTKSGNVNIKGDLGVFHTELGIGMDAEEFFIQYAHLGNVNKLMSKPNYSVSIPYRKGRNKKMMASTLAAAMCQSLIGRVATKMKKFERKWKQSVNPL